MPIASTERGTSMKTTARNSLSHGAVGLPLLTVLLAGLEVGALQAGEAPRVRELRTQRVGETVYFHVRLEPPADLDGAEPARVGQPAGQPVIMHLTKRPRLVPQDDTARAVYQRFQMPAAMALPAFSPAESRGRSAPPNRPEQPAVQGM